MSVYLIHGQPGTGKNLLGQKLLSFLKTSKRNWRRDVFHMDEEHPTDCIKQTCEFIASYGCDIILSVISPKRTFIEKWKEDTHSEIIEIYLYADNIKERTDEHIFSEYEKPEVNFIQIDTTGHEKQIESSFSKLITNLNKIGKL